MIARAHFAMLERGASLTRLPRVRLGLALGLMVVLPALAAAAGPAPLRCAGASTMRDLVRLWADGFLRADPAARVTLTGSGSLSADGFVDLLAGRTDCVTFARELFPSEAVAFAARFGTMPLVVPVASGSYDTLHATHAIAIYVNAANPLRRLSVGALTRLFAAPPHGDKPGLTRWGQLGLRGAWADRPIHLYGMLPFRASGNPPGIVNFLEQRLLGGGDFRGDVHVVLDRPGEPALQGVVDHVAHDPDGIGYSGFGFARAGAKTLALCGRDGVCVAGTPQTVASGRYPLRRTIYLLFPRGRDGRAAPLARAFLRFALSAKGQALVARSRERFLPLPVDIARRARNMIDGRAAPLAEPFGLRALPRYVPHAVSPPRHAPYVDAKGAIRIVGYNDMRPMLAAIDTLFVAAHPGFRFALDLKGTRTAPAALTSGRSAMAPMGAQFEAAPLAAYRHVVGNDPLGIRVAHDALDPRALSSPLAIYVHRGNPLSRLTKNQLRRIFSAEPGGIRSWGQLGLGGRWRDRPLHRYGLTAKTALAKYLADRLFAGRGFAPLHGFHESRTAIRAMADDPDAIGFADLNLATSALKVVGLSACKRCPTSHGSAVDIVAGRYLLDRYLLIFVRKRSGKPLGPFIAEYLRLMLSREGQEAVFRSMPHYLPLNAAEAAAERAKLR